MKPTTFNNALVAVVSAYAEVMQELVTENSQLKDSLRALRQVNAVPDGEMLVSKRQYMKLRAALTSGEPMCEDLAIAARELVRGVEGDGWDEDAR